MQNDIDRYVRAATRTNTRRSYRAAIRHFEEEWGGFLPATAESVARYLAEHADRLSASTLKLRLAALSRWHQDQGFPDPTKTPLVRKVLKGIGELHPARSRQAKPLQLHELEQVDAWLSSRIASAERQGDEATRRRCSRDRSLVLLGFWRAFRGDELTRLRVEHIHVIPGEGMLLYLPRTKTRGAGQGIELRAPALSRLCPVDAYLDWIHAAAIERGPLYRAIDRWGNVGSDALHANSLIPLLRECLRKAGVASSSEYSGHSLRRGFASWANANQWDVKSLMEYVGWKDVKSAMRYIDRPDAFAQARIEKSLGTQLPETAAPHSHHDQQDP